MDVCSLSSISPSAAATCISSARPFCFSTSTLTLCRSSSPSARTASDSSCLMIPWSTAAASFSWMNRSMSSGSCSMIFSISAAASGFAKASLARMSRSFSSSLPSSRNFAVFSANAGFAASLLVRLSNFSFRSSVWAPAYRLANASNTLSTTFGCSFWNACKASTLARRSGYCSSFASRTFCSFSSISPSSRMAPIKPSIPSLPLTALPRSSISACACWISAIFPCMAGSDSCFSSDATSKLSTSGIACFANTGAWTAAASLLAMVLDTRSVAGASTLTRAMPTAASAVPARTFSVNFMSNERCACLRVSASGIERDVRADEAFSE